jgi:hypothetical protein
MKKPILTCAFVALIAGLVFGQDLARNTKHDEKKPAAPIAKTIDAPDDIKAWQAVQSPIDENQAILNQLIQAARQAKPKDTATKAALWSDLEAAFLRGQRDGALYDDFETKMAQKYDCAGCVVRIAPDKKTLVIRPKTATELAATN